MKKKAPLEKFFQKFDVNNDGKISREEALMLLAKSNTDGSAQLSRKEFKQLEASEGDMGRGERKLFNNDFLKAIFGTNDVEITLDGNKKTFKTKDGAFLGTVEQQGDKFTFLDEAGKKTKSVTQSGSNLTTELYDDAGENVVEKTTQFKGAGTEITKYGDGKTTVTYEGDNLITQHKGIVKEEFYSEDGVEFKKTTDIDGKEVVYTNKAAEGEKADWQEFVKEAEPEEEQEAETPSVKDSLTKFSNQVTVDESISDSRFGIAKEWETTVKVPQRAEYNESGAPSEIQLGLPTAYGTNKFQTLKLVDAANNIYQDKAGKRTFQIVITDDGMTLLQVEADEIGKAPVPPKIDENPPQKAKNIPPEFDPNKPVDDDPNPPKVPSSFIEGQTIENADGTKMTKDWFEISVVDQSGKEIRKIHLYDNENNSVGFYEDFEYDTAGNVTRVIGREPDGKLNYYHEYEYDANGNRVRDIYRQDYDGDDEFDWAIANWTDYEYDSTGNLVREISRDDDGSSGYYTEYKYDDAGKKTSEITRDPDGTLWGYCEYKYNDAGEEIRSIYRDANGKIKRF